MTAKQLLAKLRQYPIPIAALAVSLGLVGMIVVRSPRVSELEDNLLAKESEWEQIQRNAERAHLLPDHLAQLQSFHAGVEERLITREEVALNQSYFFALESRTGVRITSIRQNPGVPTADQLPAITLFDVINYQLTLTGRYADILRFLYELEHGEVFARLDQLRLEGAKANAGGEVVATLNLYLLGRKKA